MDEEKVELANGATNEAPVEPGNVSPAVENVNPKPKKSKKKVFGLIVFILGLATLVGGVVFMLINLLRPPTVQDADFLEQIGAWHLKDNSEVVWDFTEIGKGSLTTNFHINDYDFIWRMDGDVLKIETAWLYTLNDEYTYELDQNDKTLTLTSGEETFVFVPAEYKAAEEEAEAEEKETEAETN